MSEPETLYIVVTGDFHGDLTGALVSKDEVLWGHVSSSEGWLRRDLTTGFQDRAATLAARFPDGYTVELIRDYESIPAAIAHHFTPSTSGTREP